ncbi:T9SS type B sorting domain-containing protein, partial [Corallibacter vietnamensis]
SQTETLFSDSNGEVILTDLASGLYQSISIEEVTTGCIDDLGQIDLECMGQEILCFKTKMFFTPNGDGFNDFWHLEMLSNSCDYILYIFNRYGKLLKTLTPFDDKWDGTYNGLNMPSSDYWYLVDYDNGQGNLQYKSHFTLKR